MADGYGSDGKPLGNKTRATLVKRQFEAARSAAFEAEVYAEMGMGDVAEVVGSFYTVRGAEEYSAKLHARKAPGDWSSKVREDHQRIYGARAEAFDTIVERAKSLGVEAGRKAGQAYRARVVAGEQASYEAAERDYRRVADAASAAMIGDGSEKQRLQNRLECLGHVIDPARRRVHALERSLATSNGDNDGLKQELDSAYSRHDQIVGEMDEIEARLREIDLAERTTLESR